jgi:type IV secretory pathway VirD2 relaxase
MSGNDDFRVRPGKIRSTRGPQTKSFLAQALQAAQKAGGLSRGSGSSSSRFGRGRAASRAASRMLQARGRGAMVKARVVRQMRSAGALRAHIGYLKRDGVTRDGSAGKLFDAAGDDADGRDFAERCEGDRHHFRFIISPDDAGELSSLRGFTRELMDQASRDFGTRLDWVAVDHWNTEHPHIHILVRGRADDGSDLVISRDYIGSGLRARAGDLVTRELGPRSELEVRRGLEAEVKAERWTRFDRLLAREAGRAEGVVDLRPMRDAGADPVREVRIGRMRTLERMGLAKPAGLYHFMKRELFDPLGMSHTKFVLDTPEEHALMAEPFTDDTILVETESVRRSHPEWEAGGSGLVSTLFDYARFAQMLLNGGELDGKRYLSRAAFDDMTTDHVGLGSGVGHDYLYFPGAGFGFGYGVAVRTALGEMRLAGSIGELKWDSGSGTYFGVNPELDMIYILMAQVDKERGPIRDSLRKLVYGVFSPDP